MFPAIYLLAVYSVYCLMYASYPVKGSFKQQEKATE